MSKMYRVEWSATFEAEDPIDAAKIAWVEIESQNAPYLYVELYEGDGSDRIIINMTAEPLEIEYAPRTV
jgi:hypothetical protein